MIILKIPRRVDNRNLREFILRYVKKFRRNQQRKYIRLRGEVAYSKDYAYFILEPYGLELAFALSVLIKCEQNEIPCTLRLSKPINLEELPNDVLEAAKCWAERKLRRKYYKLRNIAVE